MNGLRWRLAPAYAAGRIAPPAMRSDHRIVGGADRECLPGPVQAPCGERGFGQLLVEVTEPRGHVAVAAAVAEDLDAVLVGKPLDTAASGIRVR